MAARKYDFFSGEQGLESFTLYLHQIKLSYGHDYPEAVQDGLWMAAKELSWRVPEANQNVIKLMILIADSPAHGYYSDEDHYGKDGQECGCGKKLEDIVGDLSKKNIILFNLNVGK